MDIIEAHKWFQLASLMRGFELAKKALSIIELKMTPEQIAELIPV